MRYRNSLFIPLFILSFILSLSFFLVSQGISASADTKEQVANEHEQAHLAAVSGRVTTTPTNSEDQP
jgi:hypothetical protein